MRSAIIALAVAAVAEAFAPVCPTAVRRRASLPGARAALGGGAAQRRARLLGRPPAAAGPLAWAEDKGMTGKKRGPRRPRLAPRLAAVAPSGACVFVGYSY